MQASTIQINGMIKYFLSWIIWDKQKLFALEL